MDFPVKVIQIQEEISKARKTLKHITKWKKFSEQTYRNMLSILMASDRDLL